MDEVLYIWLVVHILVIIYKYFTNIIQGTGQLTVNYPQLEFAPDCFFAMGSPIAMFIVVRGNETLGKDFRLPTCPRYFNIYHPYDPIVNLPLLHLQYNFHRNNFL